MASVTEPRPPQKPAGDAPRAGELLVDQQIRRTRRALKMVDFATGMITLVIGVLAFLLTAAALEHWVIPGGWSTGMRTVLFVVLVLGVLWYSWRVFWPLLRQPINPAYAALAIEKSSPSLKNSLLNFLLLRNRKRQLSRQVFQAIEQQAAQRLSQVPIESVVDRSAILRLGSLLLAVVAICAIYSVGVVSPKDLVASVGRVLLPWKNIDVPSRVQISAISPGDTQTAKGDQIAISAEVLGLKENEPVRLLYSTADEQIVEQEILMAAGAGGVHFKVNLPGRMSDGGGVQQDLSYWIEAGDARTARYDVSVFARPTLVVQRVRYNYPDYTGYPSREEASSGDLSAVEGTVVTITALSNQPIESGHVDFEADGRHDLSLKVDDHQATISFPLELRDDRRTPRYQSYVLRYTTTEGRKNKLPPKYQIDVTPDYSPEIRLVSPEKELIDVEIDEQVTLEVEARDPDFAVQNVTIFGEVAGQQVLKEKLLSANHTGRFVGRLQLTPSEQGLKVGDVLEYWGAAADNRRPKANLASTKHQKIRVVGPGKAGEQQSDEQGEGEGGEGQPQPGEGESDASDEGGENNEGESDDSAGESGEEGEQGQGQSGAGEDGEGKSDEQQEGQAGEGKPSEGDEDSQSKADGQAGGNSEGEQQENEPSQNEGGEPSEDSSAGGEQEKVSPDGDDDGEAFDRMEKHFDEQDGEETSEQSEVKEQQGAEGEAQPEKDGDAAKGKADPDQSDHGESAEEAKTGEAGNSDPSEENGENSEGKQQDESSAGEGAKSDDAEGKGAEGDQAPQQEEGGQEEGGQEEEGKQQGDQPQEEGSPDGQMSKEQGPAGEGENPGENEGPGGAQDDKSPQEKEGDQAGEAEQNDQEPAAEGAGKEESDSEGSQGGDRSGGGQEGAGQQADAEGKGGAGEHQPADQGGGKSEQPGEGETAAQPGGDKKADDATGESSQDKPGDGSEQGEKPGDQAGGDNQGEKGESQPGDAGEETPAEGKPSDQQSDGQESDSSTPSQQPTDGGQGGKSSPPPSGGETQPGDEANLDYARKQTDLILDKLDDQLKKKEADEKLLEKLGWSKDELRRFVDRWKNLKQQAEGEAASAAAQQKLDDALRSLGLGNDRRTGFRSQTAKDKLRELQDSYRVKTPLEYQQRVRAYIKGTAAEEEE